MNGKLKYNVTFVSFNEIKSLAASEVRNPQHPNESHL